MLALGVTITAKTDLGVTPVNSIAYVGSRIFSLDLGLMTGIVCGIYVLLQIAIERKEFRISGLLQLGVSVLFGWFVFLCNRILSFLSLPGIYWIRILCLLGGLMIIGFGIFIYLRAELSPHPADGLLLAIQKKTGWKLQNVKIFLDSSLTVIAIVFSLIAIGKVAGLREGTFIGMVGIGKIMGFLSERFGAKADAFFKLHTE